ncbi:hypothetical protein RZS08_67305, partial [Arthrospira platensis SPKY1]|nr:hypothetical protein [Arthrospira platensis SPKY1]
RAWAEAQLSQAAAEAQGSARNHRASYRGQCAACYRKMQARVRAAQKRRAEAQARLRRESRLAAHASKLPRDVQAILTRINRETAEPRHRVRQYSAKIAGGAAAPRTVEAL